MELFHIATNPQMSDRDERDARRRVLITGAAGRLGSCLAEHSHQKYDLRLMVRPTDRGAQSLRSYGQIVYAELTDLDALKRACHGIDTVVHMAGEAGPSAQWDSILPNHIIGTYNIFTAARAARCRRLVFASSIHAVSGYPADMDVKTADPVNPGDLYGVSKCFGEAMGRFMAEQEGLSTIVVRIGVFPNIEPAGIGGSTGLSPLAWRQEVNQLIELCVDAPDLRFAIVHAHSAARSGPLDLGDMRQLLGYQPIAGPADLHPHPHRRAAPLTWQDAAAATEQFRGGV